MYYPEKNHYMGGPLDITTGPKGEIANTKLINHTETLKRKVYKITDGVYNIVGVGLANSTMIEGEEGLVIIDTGDCIEQSEEHYEEFKKLSDKPVKAIIYTHSHYAFGTSVYIEDDNKDDIQIWAHEDVHKTATSFITEIAPAFRRRASIQFGLFVPEEGPDAAPNQGLALYLFDRAKGANSGGYITPTHTISGEQEETIAGIRFKFASFASDTDDTIIIWLPDKKVAVNNHYWPTFANIYPLRGAAYRAPDEWIAGLDYMRQLDVEHLVGVHGPPLSGIKEVHEALTIYRDGIQFIYDQTIRGINLALSPDELVDMIQLPETLANSPHLEQLYGEIPFYIRQIYNGIMGWFGNDAATLHRTPVTVEAKKMVSGFGGRGKMINEIKTALNDREYSWAAQLSSYLVRTDPEDEEARKLKAAALRYIGQATTAANTRNFCITQALELEGKVNTMKPPFKFVTKTQILQTPPGTFVKVLSVRLNPEKAAGVDQSAGIYLTNLNVGFTLHVRNGIVVFSKSVARNEAMGIELERDAWARIIMELFEGDRRKYLSLLMESSTIRGDAENIKKFFDMFE